MALETGRCMERGAAPGSEDGDLGNICSKSKLVAAGNIHKTMFLASFSYFGSRYSDLNVYFTIHEGAWHALHSVKQPEDDAELVAMQHLGATYQLAKLALSEGFSQL
ncbi:uncharacterized protein SETTUDRAFT_30422 [Exserohilum turcica Et28A]|uniref:Uncharacterized protein n=1 Tax=Exserohilum turcicum (strain 28A) TaxID=671987 RepID=R0KSH6_EXST2|nr:uncharacterized protein SETTUDRAFT_30422 [Exserohilum turcica Et28A]EOA91929.1 hypothetical protein SETTUDRAFT_30422 [Exserohilum turcica Et28A]